MGGVAPLIKKEVLKAGVWAPIAVSSDVTERECRNGDKTIKGRCTLPNNYESGRLPKCSGKLHKIKLEILEGRSEKMSDCSQALSLLKGSVLS